jgi:uncharacterized protein YecE (DUF72 family)
MKILTGTSGFSYKEWKGSFYPQKLPQKDMLAFYASQLPAVEINHTFYRLPKVSVLDVWAEQVPEGFRFVLKASRRITHFKRLKEAGDENGYLVETAMRLGSRLGPILYQLPPNMKKDRERLEGFLEILPDSIEAAFEFRHPSWFDEEICAALRSHNCALCIADTEEADSKRVVSADWGYLRLRRSSYSETDLEEWLEWIRDQEWSETFVFFKHEDEGTGPRLARRFLELAGQ